MASERETVGRDNLVELSLLLELIPNTGTKGKEATIPQMCC